MRRRVLRRLIYALAVTSVITALGAAGLSAGTFGGFQRRASDSLFPSAKTDHRVMVVGIDGKTIRALNTTSLSRTTQAELGRRLASAGASVIVWDVIFSGERDGDPDLQSALSQIPAAVIGESLITKPSPTDPTLYTVKREDLVPLPEFAHAGHTLVGHVNVINDTSDGVVRTVPLVYEQNGRLIPAISVQALSALVAGGSPVRIKPDGVTVGHRFVPTEGRHLLRLNFAEDLDSAQAPKVVSAIDILNGTADPKKFAGAVVFIGATSSALGDTKLVPDNKSNSFPGVMIHANALNTMLTASYIAPASHTDTVIVVGLLTLLVALFVLFLPLAISIPLVFVLVIGYYLVWNLSFDAGKVRDIAYPLIAIALSFVASLGIKYFTETRQRRRVSSLFAQYVPATVAKQLEESGSIDAHLEGERLDVSLFFCDLRGFTSLSATLEPPDVRAMLNQFYDLTSNIILAHRGTVLKFVGDEVFAAFGAPLAVPDHPQVALDCAMEIQRRASELDATLADLNIPPIKFGIGMNSGEVVAAHIGGGNRRQYDIVGDTVNLGSRLCGQAGKGEIVLPESMVERLSNPPPMESMGAVALKGLTEPVPVFKVVVGESEPRQPVPATS